MCEINRREQLNDMLDMTRILILNIHTSKCKYVYEGYQRLMGVCNSYERFTTLTAVNFDALISRRHFEILLLIEANTL